ncbi:hypothetical protein [Desulfobotulus sp.]|uniref:hypothetical protein n=1 Tax=Desulfobotulus sp. TaxID=1940337 RepID=UPI002A36941A|nr:hypothetical protein [Desulfobotulus sp.]MDY0163341.1 hypothetical protein [Desulfobotulus sp.]
MEEKKEFEKEAFLKIVQKLPCVRRVVVAEEEKNPEGSGWMESEEEYQKRQAAWLEERARKKKEK